MYRQITAVIIVFLLLVGCTNAPAQQDDTDTSTSYQAWEGAELSSLEYVGDNNWEYVVTVNKPTPCYEVDSEVIIRESLPEQVTIQVQVSQVQNPDLVCTQVITPEEVSGTFEATEQAEVELEAQIAR